MRRPFTYLRTAVIFLCLLFCGPELPQSPLSYPPYCAKVCFPGPGLVGGKRDPGTHLCAPESDYPLKFAP